MAALPTTVAGHAERMTPGFSVTMPFGPGPFPVALQLHGCAGAQPFQKTYAAFPSLTSARGWQGARPKVFAVLGGKDAVVGVRHPQAALDRLRRDGLGVEALVFPDATHAFDDDDANDPRTRYRADLSVQARGFYVEALRAAVA